MQHDYNIRKATMSKGFIISLVLGGILLFGSLIYFQSDVRLKFARNEAAVEHVQFSVVRYAGKIVSVRLLMDGSGKLQTRHRISKESVGMAFYEQRDIIERIQRADNIRAIVGGSGFTHEVIQKEVALE